MAENIPLAILFQDEHIAVINKQPGLVVHPGPGNYGSTLVSALLYHIKKLSSAGDPHRPGIVHRLDRDTSGLMVIAKTDEAYEGMVKQFQDAFNDVAKLPKIESAITPIGFRPESGDAQALSRIVQDDLQTWGPIIKESGYLQQ